jgi:hypothetical protein
MKLSLAVKSLRTKSWTQSNGWGDITYIPYPEGVNYKFIFATMQK